MLGTSRDAVMPLLQTSNPSLARLVSGAGFSKVVAQAIAIVAGTPLSFLGQKLWSFRA